MWLGYKWLCNWQNNFIIILKLPNKSQRTALSDVKSHEERTLLTLVLFICGSNLFWDKGKDIEEGKAMPKEWMNK